MSDFATFMEPVHFAITGYGDHFIITVCSRCEGWEDRHYAPPGQPVHIDVLIENIAEHMRKNHRSELSVIEQITGLNEDFVRFSVVPYAHDMLN